MFRIKICGVTAERDIADVAAAGADAVGLNFHPPSIRFLEPPRAAALATRAAAAGLTTVGVFVGATAEQIRATAEQLELDYVQLHGKQTAADAAWLAERGCRVIRVVRLPAGPLDPQFLRDQVAGWEAVDCPLLLDAEVGSHGGGMGMRLDWDGVGRWAQSHGRAATWGLAGGLTPETVADAITRTATWAIDVASGVEAPRGKKSQPLIEALVTAAKAAWDAAASRAPAAGAPK